MGDEGLHAALGRSVIIVGTGSLQNKLLASLIEQRTGYACSTTPADRLNGSLPATSLALIDAAEFAMRMQALCVAGLFELALDCMRRLHQRPHDVVRGRQAAAACSAAFIHI